MWVININIKKLECQSGCQYQYQNQKNWSASQVVNININIKTEKIGVPVRGSIFGVITSVIHKGRLSSD